MQIVKEKVSVLTHSPKNLADRHVEENAGQVRSADNYYGIEQNFYRSVAQDRTFFCPELSTEASRNHI